MSIRGKMFALASATALLLAGGAQAATSDAEAFAMTKPQEQIVASGVSRQRLAEMLRPVEAFYAFWVNGNPKLLALAAGQDFVDHTLPPGRPQGPEGPLAASGGFLQAVPDLNVKVVQRLVVGDRVVSHLRFSGHFSGSFKGRIGGGQPVDFIATDIVRVRGGHITDNWHLEDNLTFLQQIGALPS